MRNFGMKLFANCDAREWRTVYRKTYWRAHTCLILVLRKNHVIVFENKRPKSQRKSATQSVSMFEFKVGTEKQRGQLWYVCQYWWSIYVVCWSCCCCCFDSSHFIPPHTHTNINRIAAINHIQWVIYIYMHCLWFKSSSYDVNVDVVESCSSRFFPSAQFNADVSLHIHALCCMHVCVCVCVEYVYLYFISWLHIFFYYLLV